MGSSASKRSGRQVTFYSTGKPQQTYVVPEGVSSLSLTLKGGSGGDLIGQGGRVIAAGGKGGYVSATLVRVRPGQRLDIVVGAQGKNSAYSFWNDKWVGGEGGYGFVRGAHGSYGARSPEAADYADGSSGSGGSSAVIYDGAIIVAGGGGGCDKIKTFPPSPCKAADSVFANIKMVNEINMGDGIVTIDEDVVEEQRGDKPPKENKVER